MADASDAEMAGRKEDLMVAQTVVMWEVKSGVKMAAEKELR